MTKTSPSDPPAPENAGADPMSALFAGLVMQQTNMALMFLGRLPHPEKGETITDLDAARLFIDTLEMLENRTRGNLTEEEARLLKQSLTTVRLAYVEAANEVRGSAPQAGRDANSPSTASATPSAAAAGANETAGSQEETGRKRFVKKYPSGE